jgi:hypothetical protein
MEYVTTNAMGSKSYNQEHAGIFEYQKLMEFLQIIKTETKSFSKCPKFSPLDNRKIYASFVALISFPSGTFLAVTNAYAKNAESI